MPKYNLFILLFWFQKKYENFSKNVALEYHNATTKGAAAITDILSSIIMTDFYVNAKLEFLNNEVNPAVRFVRGHNQGRFKEARTSKTLIFSI